VGAVDAVEDRVAVWRKRGVPVAVVDAKYKAKKYQGYPNSDLYQLLAYCTVLGLPQGHLVYAKGTERAARHRVRQSGTEIFCHASTSAAIPGRCSPRCRV
jgi:5-methylcytosine-specific restriction enzyme subunit McrC